ncbi:MAG: type II toxin-antitoxin system VapC family toxin [Betaproteobacteria bacterium]|nr:type II toxin-antitoxin system VapC family toxin [Betaproteobacteria bacterium]
MIALDTNVLARFYIEEDEPEAKRQHLLAARVMASPALFVARTVVLELEWVLRGGYGYAREDIADVIEHLLGLPNVTVENWEMVSDALTDYRAGIDFADALHHAAGKAATFATFDAKFVRAAAKRKLQPPVTLVKAGG